MSNPILETLTMTITKNKGTPSESKEERTYDIPQGTVTEADLEEAEGTKADAIVRNASGDIASYDDGGDLPMKSLKVNIVPKQSGTGDPSPSNVRPISGTDEVGIVKMGKNLLNPTLLVGYYDVTNNGAFVSSSTWRACEKVRCKPSTKYIISGSSYSGGGSNAPVIFWDENDNYISHTSGATYFTTPANAYKMAFYIGDGLVTDHMQLEEGQTATDYEPYQADTKSITLPQTVYGGTLDVVSGKLVIDTALKTYSDGADWTYIGGNGAYKRIIKTNVSPIPYFPNDATVYIEGVYANMLIANIASGVNHVAVISPSSGETVPRIDTYWDASDSNFASLTAFGNFLASHPLQVAYKMATPIEIDLTPTEVKSLLGDNNVWSDSGTVEVEYRADTSLVINKILEALA